MLPTLTRGNVGFFLCFAFSGIFAQDGCRKANEFLCRSGDCIQKEFLCDGSKECIDGSDETHDLCKFRSCSISIDYLDKDPFDIFAIPTLDGRSFRCSYGACISNQFICDGIRHCVADGSDETEELCSKHKCEPRQFRCDYGGCILRRNACDNRHQCFDHSDETPRACRWRQKPCSSSKQFQCDYGACIRKSKKCDGKVDCIDGSDESVSTCGERPGIVIDGTNPRVRPTSPPRVTTPKPTEPKNGGTDSKTSAQGCVLPEDFNIPVEIIICGDDSFCLDDTVPPSTMAVITCKAKHSITLRCKDDGLWYFVKDSSKAPRKDPCQDAGTHGQPGVNPVGERIFTPVPTECGIVSPFEPLPWLVGLFRKGNFSCTGTIIGPALILTAGHCIVSNQATNTQVMNANDLKIQFNSKNPNDFREFASVSGIELHPNYKGGQSLQADIALLFLTKNLAEEEGMSSVCLDEEGALILKQAWTFNRTVGQDEYKWDNFQQTFDRSCVNKATECTRHLNTGPNQFCAINEDKKNTFLHQGASGGPYLITKVKNDRLQWAVAGVVSNSIKTTQCGTRTVFTYVNTYRSWIVNCGFHGKCNF